MSAAAVRDEVAKPGDDLVHVAQPRKVLRSVELDERRLRDPPGRGPRLLDAHDWIPGALQNEHRLVNRVENVPGAEPGVDRGHVLAGDGARRARALQPPPGGVSVRHAGEPAVPVEPLPPAFGGSPEERQLVVECGVGQVALCAAVEPAGRRVQHHESPDAVRARRRGQGRSHPAL